MMDDTVQYSWQEKFVAITPKPFAILSMCGSICIAKHIIFTSPRPLSSFHRILFGLSVIDLTTSFAVFMGTWPIPVGTTGVYLASGNKGLCTAQGFWIQLGVGAPLYNASLSVYYFLVIFKGWREHQIKKVEPFLHAIPIIFALTTSIIVAATDNFRSSNVWCWISMDNIAMRFGFFYGPIWAAILWVTCSMAAIYCRFLVQERKNKRYQGSGQAGNNAQQLHSTATNVIGRLQSTTNIGNTGMRSSTVSTSRSKSSKIAGQALCYVGSFYLTFLFPSWTRISQMMGRQPPFAVVAMFTIFFPMQGFYNALVFFRPKIKSYLSERRKKGEGGGGDDFQIET